jgi:hypothetical protein
MVKEYRPDVLGTPKGKIENVDPEEAVVHLESDLQKEIDLLRKMRSEHASGKISDEEFKRIEADFEQKLDEKRQLLQSLKRAVQEKKE